MHTSRRSLLTKLRKTRKDSGLTLAQLKAKMRTRLTVVSLSRKLSGKQPSTIAELAAMAEALGLAATVVQESIEIDAAPSSAAA